MAVEIGVAMEIGVGLGFLFTGLVVGGVFLGFCRGDWLVLEGDWCGRGDRCGRVSVLEMEMYR